jgi:hypothetical protein
MSSEPTPQVPQHEDHGVTPEEMAEELRISEELARQRVREREARRQAMIDDPGAALRRQSEAFERLQDELHEREKLP